MANGKRLTTADFIIRAQVVHDDKFDYSNVAYVNSHTKVTIICPIHGEFQQKPNDHLRGNGCYACSGKRRTTTDEFINGARAAIGNKYDFSKVEYKNLDTPVTIICPEHGEFVKSPRLVLQRKQGCQSCGRQRLLDKSKRSALSVVEFIERATTVHDNKYDYSSVVYTSGSSRVMINCPEHGEFLQRPDNHLQGEGCPSCGRLRSGGKGGYTFEYFETNPDERSIPAVLYLVDIINGSEHFIKIGITTKSVDRRFNRTEYNNMVITPIRVGYMSLYDAFCIEQQILSANKEHQFFSNSRFSGYTECFRPSEEVLKSCNDLINNAIIKDGYV